MAKLNRKKGATSQILHVSIQDSSSLLGAGLTGLAYTGAGITPTVKYINAGGTLSASITLEDITTLGTYQAPTANTNMRFKEINSASPSQGVYEIHIHNDWMNLTGGSLVIMMAGATNMAQFRLEIDLQADANVTHVAGTAQTAGDIVADTNDIQTQIGTAGAGLTALGDTRIANLDTTVSSRSTFAGGAVASVTGNVAGNVNGSVNSVVTSVTVGAYAATLSPAGVKKNTALNNFEFYMIDSSDDVSGKTGLTVTAERSIDGAAFGACANAVSEVSNGLYKINLAAADLNGDGITLKFTATGANATVITILTKA